jgi:hypothetical protein
MVSRPVLMEACPTTSPVWDPIAVCWATCLEASAQATAALLLASTATVTDLLIIPQHRKFPRQIRLSTLQIISASTTAQMCRSL